MSPLVVAGLALALLCVVLGVVLGGAVVHLLRSRPKKPPQPEPPVPTVAIDEAQGMHELARLVALLEQVDPMWTRRVVDDMTDRGVLAVYLAAALAAIVASAEMVRSVRSTADELLVTKAWNLPAAERPEPEP